MPVTEELLSSFENWYEVVSIKDYQYPGVFAEQGEHNGDQHNPPRTGHVHELPHFTGQHHHLLYYENQLLKGHYNDNIRQVNIDGQTREVHVCHASCTGVLKYSIPSCTVAGSKTIKK